jgi:hypothetical protein
MQTDLGSDPDQHSDRLTANRMSQGPRTPREVLGFGGD